MPATLDEHMETASQALAEMDYARCEALCVDALGKARDAKDWVIYQRVLLPLQEARRQRRQAALDGPILLGTPEQRDIVAQIDDLEQGCIALTWPTTSAEVVSIAEQVRQIKKPIELLFADNASDSATWRITSFTGPELSIDLPAPKREWIGQWVDPASVTPPTPAHWFMQASEALGNAALAVNEAEPGSVDFLLALEHALACVDDHEILHQRLAAAAKALHEAQR